MIDKEKDPPDYGYVNMANLVLKNISCFNNTLTMAFQSSNNEDVVCEVIITDVLSFNGIINKGCLNYLRVDDGGSSFALHMSIRAKRAEVKEFKVLYFFEKMLNMYTFRCIGREITIVNRHEAD